MRLRIILRPIRPDTAVPADYQYHLSSAIYRILADAAPAYASFLHDEGYESSNQRRLKLFCFSSLWSDRKPVSENSELRWFGRPRICFTLASPMEETFIRGFVIGMFRNNRLRLGGSAGSIAFLIENVEIVSSPAWKEEVLCVARSPLTVSLQEAETRRIRYLNPLESRFSASVEMNLLRKHEAVHGPFTQPHSCRFMPDSSYIESKGGLNRISRLITVKKDLPEESRVKGYLFPFRLILDRPLLQTAWDCGLGEKNSMGFGMWEEVEECQSTPQITVR